MDKIENWAIYIGHITFPNGSILGVDHLPILSPKLTKRYFYMWLIIHFIVKGILSWEIQLSSYYHSVLGQNLT